MSTITALEELHEDLILCGQPENRRNELAEKLCEGIKEYLDAFPDKNLSRRLVRLFPCEVLAVQHFLTQFGFYLKRISIPRNHVEEPLTYSIHPNWWK